MLSTCSPVARRAHASSYIPQLRAPLPARSLARRRAPLERCLTARAQQSAVTTVEPTGIVNNPFGLVTFERGFLPATDPLRRLPADFQVWEDALDDIPKLCVASGTGTLRSILRSLPPFPLDKLLTISYNGNGALPTADGSLLWRAYLLLSFLAHAYVWCEDGAPPPTSLPAVIAVPWVKVAEMVGMPPILVYATYNMYNWRRIDSTKPIELGNIVCLQNFLGGMDEEWFRLIHVEIEAKAAHAVAQLPALQQAVTKEDVDTVTAYLTDIAAALADMQLTLQRTDEKCDPYVYYKRVRAPMAGWRNNPNLPNGLIYEGVSDQPFELNGETGAQSSIAHAFDAALGVQHQDGWLKEYLGVMRRHMPPAHRAFISKLESGPTPRLMTGGEPRLAEAYNAAINELEKFRSYHRAYAYKYIAKFAKEAKGTGGLNIMQDLTGYRNTTKQHYV